jgi:hypothetical protein
LGCLNDEFMLELIPFMKHVKTINLYDQSELGEKILIKLIRECVNLESLCLNGTSTTFALLAQILETNTNLQRLSIIDCALLKDDVEWFCDQVEQWGKPLKRLYCDISTISERSIIVKTDSWFLDQKLDILVLWATACKKSI